MRPHLLITVGLTTFCLGVFAASVAAWLTTPEPLLYEVPAVHESTSPTKDCLR